jgi:aminopeptidase N
MKRIIYFLSLLLIIISMPLAAQSVEKKGSELCSEKKMNSRLQLLSGNLTTTGAHSFDMLDYNLNLDIYNCFLTPYPSTFKGSEIITLLADSSINSIQLNAINTSLQIDSVRLSGAGFVHTNNILTISLDRTYAPGETLYVKIYYQHKNIADGAFYVQSGMVFTDCEPEGARKWFPCWDKPSDKATMSLKVITPGSVKLGSNGRLADSVKSNDTVYYSWISRDPVATYLMVISAKVNYNLDIKYWHKISNPLDSIPFRFYWNTGESGLANIETKVLQMCDRYSTLWGEHAFEKNGFSTLNNQFAWGGMENQTLTSLCPNCWSENLVSHEFAHQWFGDMITCATWADIMLNEGFATFCEAIWYETTSGYTSYKNDIISDANYYLTNNPGLPISNPDWAVNTPDVNTLFNTAMTYDKGACVLHQLRYVMGDSLFFIGMHNYGTSNLRYKSATIGDYAAFMTTAYGQDLSWFFNEWVYQPNHPLYTNKYYISQAGSNWEVGFQAIQTQTNTVFFQMPLQIAINYSSGPADTLRVFNNVNNQLFTFNVTRQPVSVVFDPKNNIVLKNATLTQVSSLPVELTSFTAEVKAGLVLLKWKTATEINNRGFEIERAKVSENIDELNPNRILFSTMGFVTGGGSSTTTKGYSFTDNISSFGKYVYRLKQVDFNGNYKYSSNVQVSAGAKPTSFTLNQNYPNPFNPTTTIRFEVPKSSRIKLTVYNMLGEAIRVLSDAIFEEGVYEKTFDAKDMASGVYVYELKTDNVLLRQKMVLQK